MPEGQRDPEPWLIVILTSPLGLAWSDADIGAGFTVDSDLFEQVADTVISGFYDRLYSSDGWFVGVQIAPIAWPTLATELPELESVRSMHEGCLFHVLFRTAPSDLTIVWDQSFGGRIYKIAASPAAWVTVESIED